MTAPSEPQQFGQVVGIIEFIIALAVMLFAYAIRYAVLPVIQAIASIVRGIPWIGGDLAGWIYDRAQDAENYVYNVLNSAWVTVTSPWTQHTNVVANTGRADALSTRYTVEQAIAALNSVTAAVRQTHTSNRESPITTAIHAIDSRINQALYQDFQASIQYTQDIYRTATTWAYQDITAVYDDVVDADNRIATAQATLQDEVETEHSNMTAWVQQMTDYAVRTSEEFTHEANTVINNNIGYISQQINGRITNERQETDIQVQNLGDAINMNRDAILSFIQSQVLTRVSEIENFDEQCSRPTCENLLGFARLFGVGKNLLSDALLIEFLISLYHGGDAFNRQLVNDVKGFYGGPRDIITQIIGR